MFQNVSKCPKLSQNVHFRRIVVRMDLFVAKMIDFGERVKNSRNQEIKNLNMLAHAMSMRFIGMRAITTGQSEIADLGSCHHHSVINAFTLDE